MGNDIVAREVLTDDEIIESVSSNVISSDNEKKGNEFDVKISIYVYSIPEMSETCNLLESCTVLAHMWNSFFDHESYINFSSRRVQILFSKYLTF